MEDGLWFFTMDLIEGTTLSGHLSSVGPVGSAEREHELRRLLSELVDGVGAIHATGHLHRDLKPANVLVARDGGLVIVDFGLVGDFSSAGALPVVGTASHMAPEQARGEPATAASDWYAVGTIVYEALTGRIPIDGDSAEVLLRKRRAEVPRLFIDGGPWPEDLVELCRGLLSPDPASRPDCTSDPDACSGPMKSRVPSPAPSRRSSVACASSLHSARLSIEWKAAHWSSAAFLAHRGLARPRSSASFCVARPASGTPSCFPAGVTSAKRRRSSYSRGSSTHCPSRSNAMCPEPAIALVPLAALFFGLTLEAAGKPGNTRTMTELEVRSRAVDAFRTGLAELATVGTVILHIDDVHWCDADGVGLLDEVLEAAPHALLILTKRDDEMTDPLRALWRAPFLANASIVEVELEGLSKPDVVAIVRAMAGRDRSLDSEAIARESGGSPYFAAEIIRHALEQNRTGTPAESAIHTLGHTILSRYESLPSPARRILEALSVCDGPRSLRLLEAATRVDDVERAVAVLRSGTFVRTQRIRDTPSVEPYHDRVREEIHRALSDADRASLHLGFARAFEQLAPQAWESMLHHFEGAGEFAKASFYAIRSAERAAQAQAFEQAATLYRRALRLGTWEADDERKLHERLADALAMCGHNAEAVEAYDRSASGTTSSDRIRLQMLAASQVLCSGNVLEGIERLTASIGYLGVHIPEASELFPRAMASVQQALMDASELVYRDERSVDPEHLLRIDACWWAAGGLTSAYHPAGPFLTSVHLLEAVHAGEPMRIARGAYAQAAGSSATLWEEHDPDYPGLDAARRCRSRARAQRQRPLLARLLARLAVPVCLRCRSNGRSHPSGLRARERGLAGPEDRNQYSWARSKSRLSWRASRIRQSSDAARS